MVGNVARFLSYHALDVDLRCAYVVTEDIYSRSQNRTNAVHISLSRKDGRVRHYPALCVRCFTEEVRQGAVYLALDSLL